MKKPAADESISRRRVLISDIDALTLDAGRRTLEAAGYDVLTSTTHAAALNLIFAHPIQCAIFNGDTDEGELRYLLAKVEQDNIFGRVPVILLFRDLALVQGLDWEQIPADDYLIRPIDTTDLVCRVNLCTARAMRDINANPLTGLPGNHTIMREAERRLSKSVHFSMAYLDLDHFKPFNDRYGFSRGDEVLRMTARVLVNALSRVDSHETYLGHVGGDDFVFMAPPELMPQICECFIHDFDDIIQAFYDQEDKDAGGIESLDRKGSPQKFPIMSCSIGVVDTHLGKIGHLADLSTRLAQVKYFTKKLPGSRYLIDRRT